MSRFKQLGTLEIFELNKKAKEENKRRYVDYKKQNEDYFNEYTFKGIKKTELKKRERKVD